MFLPVLFKFSAAKSTTDLKILHACFERDLDIVSWFQIWQQNTGIIAIIVVRNILSEYYC